MKSVNLKTTSALLALLASQSALAAAPDLHSVNFSVGKVETTFVTKNAHLTGATASMECTFDDPKGGITLGDSKYPSKELKVTLENLTQDGYRSPDQRY